jgi:hypothetical protein
VTWVRMDENFPEHPKVAALKADAFRVHVRAICYSARYLTDGVILTSSLSMVGGTSKLAQSLVAAGLWEVADGGYVIHDYLTYNPAREEVLANRRQRAAAGSLGGRRSGASRRSKPEAPTEAFASPFASSVTNPRPVPSRPPDDSLRSSSADDPDALPSDELPPAVREIRDTVLNALPAKWRNDPGTWDEAESFARDYPGQHDALRLAIDAVRREPGRVLPFPGNLRKHMPRAAAPATRTFDTEGLDWSKVPTKGPL